MEVTREYGGEVFNSSLGSESRHVQTTGPSTPLVAKSAPNSAQDDTAFLSGSFGGRQWNLGRRGFLRSAGLAAIGAGMMGFARDGSAQDAAPAPAGVPWDISKGRPPVSQRKFTSAAVEAYILATGKRIGDPELARLFANCFPNTLDTTVEPGSFDGKPDTAVVTGDIAAMWLRDSSAQVWPYLPLAAKDAALRRLLEGVIRRQTRCILIDPYANAFMANLSAPPLSWSRNDKTEMKQGVGERKWEVDSLCYPIRLAHGYWKQTGDTAPFDAAWRDAMRLVVETFRVQQRKHGAGPYHFQRTSDIPTETLPNNGYGPPMRAVGLIASGFRNSDDACTFPLNIAANLFAVTSLTQLSAMARAVLHDDALANDASGLAAEVARAARQYGVASTPEGTIWAYEVDGYGSQLLMDDAGVPSLLGLPYLECSPDAALYARTRAFCWSGRNPWFFHGTAGEGIGGPHEGRDMIWPMSQIIYAMTSNSDREIRHALAMLKASAAGYGFMHESYYKDDVTRYTRPWFAWVNTLFGELVGKLASTKPELLKI